LVRRLPLLFLLEGIVRHTERDPEEKRLLALRLEELHRFLRDQVGGMTLLVHEDIVAMPAPVAVLVAVRVLVDLAVEIAIRLVEAILARPDLGAQAEVPLAQQTGDITARLQRA